MLPLTSDRFVLRAFRMGDAPALSAYRSDPRIAEYQSWTAPYPLERAEASIAGMIADGGPQVDQFYAIAIADITTDEVLGDVALKLEWDGRGAEVGYALRHDRHGRGLASSAVRVLLDHLFATTELQRVHASLHPDNHPSARLLERLGFVYEGTARAGYWVGDDCSDDVHYAVLRDEWAAWANRPSGAPVSVELIELGPHNREAIRRVRVHKSQERLVSSVEKSLGDALLPDLDNGVAVVPWFRGIAADGELVGFIMIAEQTETLPDPFLWRLLIDRAHQGRRIGERAVQLLAESQRSIGADRLLVSYHDGPGSPAPFYAKLGFVPTGELEGDEIVAALEL